MTMESKQADEAGRIIHGCWTAGEVIEALPDACRPRTMAEGYAAQRALAAASGEPILGWKIAATSTDGQRHINVDGPIAGRLLASRVHHKPVRGDVRSEPHGGRGSGVRVRDGQRSSGPGRRLVGR